MRRTTAQTGTGRPIVRVLALAALMLVIGTACSEAAGEAGGPASESVVVRISHDEPNHMLTHELLSEMAAQVKEETGGRVTFEISPAAELSGGDIETMIQQVQSGARLDAALIASGIYSNFASEVDIFSLPFLYQDIDDLNTVAASEIGQNVMSLTGQHGLATRDIWVRDLRQWVNGTRPIRTPEDMQGLRFRVPEFPLWVQAFEAVGAVATPMPFGEAFTAVQTGAIDGAERPTEFLIGEGWDEVADYVTLSNYAGDVLLFSFNETFWQGLPEGIRQTLDDAIEEFGDRKHTMERQRRTEFVQQLEADGMNVQELTDSEYEAFREQMTSVWDTWVADRKIPAGWIEQAQQAME